MVERARKLDLSELGTDDWKTYTSVAEFYLEEHTTELILVAGLVKTHNLDLSKPYNVIKVGQEVKVLYNKTKTDA